MSYRSLLYTHFFSVFPVLSVLWQRFPHDLMIMPFSAHTLKNARNAALKDQRYDSEQTRQTMSWKLQDVFDRRTPYDWQLNAAEAVLLGLDCVVIAGTGSGKTIPFVLPLFAQDSQDKLVLIISPLNALETDQVSFH
jgi:superfamily II DNA helicase RecQ